MHKPEFVSEKETHRVLKNFEIQMDHPKWAWRPNSVLIKKKKELVILWILLFQQTTVKLKESEKMDKYLDLARELKKLQNMKVTVILFVVGALGTVPRGLEKRLGAPEIRRRIKTIQKTTMLKSARIISRVWTIWWDLMSLRLVKNYWCEKLS